jgi:hypothetical protein
MVAAKAGAAPNLVAPTMTQYQFSRAKRPTEVTRADGHHRRAIT